MDPRKSLKELINFLRANEIYGNHNPKDLEELIEVASHEESHYADVLFSLVNFLYENKCYTIKKEIIIGD